MPMDVLDRILRPLRRGPVDQPLPRRPARPAARRPAACRSSTRHAATANAACVAACPTGAIRVGPGAWSLDAGALRLLRGLRPGLPGDGDPMGSRIELATDIRDHLVVVRSWEERA